MRSLVLMIAASAALSGCAPLERSHGANSEAATMERTSEKGRITSTPDVTKGIPKLEVVQGLLSTLRQVTWEPVTGGAQCADPKKNKVLVPTWAQITLSDVEKIANGDTFTAGTPVVLPISPSVEVDYLRTNTHEVDAVVHVENLQQIPKGPSDELAPAARQLSALIHNQEEALIFGTDAKPPCLTVGSVTVSTSLDITWTGKGSVAFNLGLFASVKDQVLHTHEAIATLKIEVNYTVASAPNQSKDAPLSNKPKPVDYLDIRKFVD